MAVRTHYNVLGVAADADDSVIRAAYRQLARDHHPDRVRSSSAAGGGRDMPAINEAYRVLSDPGRRAVYDGSLRRTPTTSSGAAGSGAGAASSQRETIAEERWDLGRPDMLRPARVPWRSLLVCAVVAIVGIVVLAQFSGAGDVQGPDGILRNGDCVEIQPNGDAREVLCAGTADLVVRAFIPFDGTCPGLTEPHRDRQGMGVACVQLPE